VALIHIANNDNYLIVKSDFRISSGIEVGGNGCEVEGKQHQALAVHMALPCRPGELDSKSTTGQNEFQDFKSKFVAPETGSNHLDISCRVAVF